MENTFIPDELEVLDYDELLQRFAWDLENEDYLSLTTEAV